MKRIISPLPFTKLPRRRSMWAGMLVASSIVLTAQPEEVSGETLRFQPLGKPIADKVEAARNINDLMLFDGRLYLGHGDGTFWLRPYPPVDYARSFIDLR